MKQNQTRSTKKQIVVSKSKKIYKYDYKKYNQYYKHIRIPKPTFKLLDELSKMLKYNEKLSKPKAIQAILWHMRLIMGNNRALIYRNGIFEVIESKDKMASLWKHCGRKESNKTVL